MSPALDLTTILIVVLCAFGWMAVFSKSWLGTLPIMILAALMLIGFPLLIVTAIILTVATLLGF